MLDHRFRYATLATFALLALPAAKGGCGPDVPIGQDDDACGGLQGLTCEADEVCVWQDSSCGVSDQLGTCEPRPQACTEEWAPVCGCDNETYGNACAARAAGVDVFTSGECDDGQGGGGQGGGGQGGGGVGPSCGGLGGTTCNPGEFCDWPDMSCGIDDGLGTCTPIPEGCTFEYDPVCGCDGQTYGNACAAHNAGVSIAASGECGGSGESCGGIGGIMCDPGEFCDWTDMSCGIADQLGTCAPLPQVCNDIYQPVCGCDGQTYGNECEAHSNGVSVASSGPC